MTHVENIRPLSEVLRGHALDCPDKVAFADEEREVTYARLAERTGRLAGHLAGSGVERGDRVAILLGNSVTTVESYLAVTRAAAVGVPVNPQSSDAELAHQLDDSGARFVITDGTHLEQVERMRASREGLLVVVAHGDARGAGTLAFEELAESEPVRAPRDDLGLDEPAWILYTSGTTGAAKGVVSHQRACLWSVHSSYRGVLGLGPDDRLLWPLPLFHSLAHILCVLGVTVTGATARILPGFGAPDVLEALRAEPFTMLLGVPSMYVQLVEAVEAVEESGRTVPKPRVCVVTGAATGAALASAVERVLAAPLVNTYGSTETCGAITISRPDSPRPSGTCGTVVPGGELRLVDPRTGLDVRSGDEGEVFVRSPSLLLRYHGRPEETEAALRDGWYRTGDLARRDAEGHLTITGRVKELIIRAGENIQPGEIEDVLRGVPGIEDAAVTGRPDEALGEVPVGYVVPAAEGWSPVEALTACRERLSYFKVPAELYEVAALPLTASGKVSRRGLAHLPARLRGVGTSHHDHLWRTRWVRWEPEPAPAGPADAPSAPEAAVGPEARWAVIGAEEPAFAEAVRRASGVTESFPDAAAARAAGPFDGYLLAFGVLDAGGRDEVFGAQGAGAPVEVLAGLDVGAGAGAGVLGAPGAGERAEVPGATGMGAPDAGVPDGVVVVVPAPEAERAPAPRIVVLTLGAVAGRPGERVEPAAASARARLLAHGAGRTVLVDVEPGERTDDAHVAAWRTVLEAPTAEPEFAVRGGEVLVPRLERVRAAAEVALPPRQGGAALVTGAGTRLAHLLAAHLVVDHGVRHLAVTGTDPAAAESLAAELTRLGAGVTVRTETPDTPEGAAALLAALGPDRPLDTVVHPVATLADAAAAERLLTLTRGAGHPTLTLCGPLVDPGVHPLDPATAAATAHAAALTHDAPHATFLAFGPITADGDAPGATPPGLAGLSARAVADAFDVGRATAGGQTLVMRTDPWTLRSAGAARLRRLLRAPAPADGAGPAADDGWRERLDGLPPRARERTLTELVRDEAARVLGLDEPRRIETGRALTHLGLTSLTAVALRDRLAARTGLRLPVTIAFDHPTPAALAAALDRELSGRRPEGATGQRPARRGDDHAHDPVVVVGMSCRYPGGVASPEDLWRLVAEGRDAIGAFPTDRGWDLERLLRGDGTQPGTSATGSGGFLDGPGDFDAAFFGISPREALAMDPQQRLLLEVGWEAIERAGIDPTDLRQTDTGVYVGLMFHDYANNPGPLPEDLERLLGTGTAGSVASGRLAYTLGLNGPALTVDTACSSSLVAIHLAAQALRRGDCSLALAGGVAVMATPSTFVEFSRQHGLAPDGRCKAFAAGADGTGWSEGVGVVVLERLSDARRSGHPVLAVIRGSAVNQDGASNGLTAPSGPAQQQVIRRALADAGLTPADVDAVEAHGTGTVLGDPIEAHALLATYGQDRDPERPLLLGSLKSNIGHAQSAAGVGAVIKMVQAIRHGELPRTLHAEQPTPAVDWASGAVRLLQERTAWPDTGGRRAAVSSFGVSGTNAHLILEQAPDPLPATVPAGLPDTVPVVLTARAGSALRRRAEDLLDIVRGNRGLDVPDLAAALATTRTAFPRRTAFVVDGAADLERRLAAVADGQDTGVEPDGASAEASLAIGFTGQGSQRPQMGKELYAAYPVFAKALDAACGALDPHLDRPLRDVMWASEGTTEAVLLDRTDFTQAALFALESALFRLVESWGVVPDLVMGHSVGALAAAHAAGVLSLQDAASLVAARGRLMAALPPGGAMAAIEATEEEVRTVMAAIGDGARTALAATPPAVAVAAVNGPRSVVVSGAEGAVRAVGEAFRARRRRVTALRVSHAFHSPLMDPMLEEFGAAARKLTYRPPLLPVISDLTGRLAETARLCSPDYWVSHARQAVRFADAVRALPGEGITAFLELGPDRLLTAMAGECVPGSGPALCGGLRRGRSEVRSLLEAVAQAHVHGVPVDWPELFAGRPARPVDVPVYPFEHRRYWLASAPADAVPARTEVSAVAAPPDEPSAAQRLRADLTRLSVESREGALTELVRAEVAAVAGFDGPHEVEAHRSMTDVGLDSVSAVDLSTRLGARTGLDLPASLAFDHPTSRAIARHLLTELHAVGLDREEGARRAPEGTVFGELARLEASVERDRPDATARHRLVERLHALAARLTDGSPGHLESAEETSLGDRIAGVTTVDQLFDLIDDELKGP
ncbi:AMP-binding protein [Streptomyces phaeoluteigriseus]|uniref:AMP-binding protein n=1 Tax=Streptomyces phaeoluteigriseus TaxID=114686 RepID=A0ABY4Z9T1_9ACTN|nr:type I polyketide synthase [Streptomyces phaeoluteigriseus]USQ85716.1 AMP-binding protein [Streptomyces phaeoluteigriseus]